MRAGLAVLSLASLSAGAWAFFAPHSFYGDFPGAGRQWVSLLPPFNEHLTTDVGGFYLAFAVLFAWAAVTLARQLIVPLLCAYLLASGLHAGYHLAHLDGYPALDAVGQTLGFALLMAVALAVLVIAVRRPAGPRAG
jgi:hypothetical protein